MKFSREVILGFSVETKAIAQCVDEILAWIEKGNACLWMACLNPHSYVQTRNDPVFSKALLEVDWLIPDGIGIILASWFLGGKIRHRITGFDVFQNVLTRLNRSGGYKVFFLGGSEETLAMIRKKMKIDYPNIKIAGTYSPPFKVEFNEKDNVRMIKTINKVKPDILWVGMTAPKQEKWIYQNRKKLRVKFAGAVGAVFDFYAGKVKRSHPLFQRMGLEWLPRLVREPRRLWRRMFISAPIFIWHLVLAKIAGKNHEMMETH